MEGEGGILAQFNNSVALWEPAMCLTYIEPRALRAQSIHWQQRDHRVGEDLPPCLPAASQDLLWEPQEPAAPGLCWVKQLLLPAVPLHPSLVSSTLNSPGTEQHSTALPLAHLFWDVFLVLCLREGKVGVVCDLRTPLSAAHKGLAAEKSQGALLGSAAPFTSPGGAC